jgi:hypothetical protein
LAVQKLKGAFSDRPILQHYNLSMQIIPQTDLSSIAIASILKQFDGFGGFCPVNFYI